MAVLCHRILFRTFGNGYRAWSFPAYGSVLFLVSDGMDYNHRNDNDSHGFRKRHRRKDGGQAQKPGQAFCMALCRRDMDDAHTPCGKVYYSRRGACACSLCHKQLSCHCGVCELYTCLCIPAACFGNGHAEPCQVRSRKP